MHLTGSNPVLTTKTEIFNMAQHTALEQLIEWIDSDCTPMDCVMKAKELLKVEKQQIEDAYNKGTINGIDYPESKLALTGEQYYTQTYGK